MSERILVAVAWPYANGSIHVGQAVGAYLPADIFARYHRLKGNDVLMVSGSDSHGTPVTLEAEARGVSPEEVFSQYHAEFLENWDRLGITFDLFTSTHTDSHAAVAQDMFTRLLEKGHIYKDTMTQPYSEVDRRFLPDRYVEGTCPHCGFDGARGDQCDNCGRTLDASDLIDIRSRISGDTPVFKETEHFFLRLSAFEDQLLEWVRKQEHWRPNVRNFSVGYLEGGLHDRAITRDIEWGVDVPLDGYEGKRIYVWFEAVIGYLSASIEWARSSGDPDRWKDFWQRECRSYYFQGKDNIPFHTVIWPSMLLGYGDLNLPYDIPANEYMNIAAQKVSTSRNWAVWLKDVLDDYDPDAIRYALASNMPETSDSDFSWKEFVRSNNDELVATYGNLVNRVLTMSYRNFDGRAPEPGELDSDAEKLLSDTAKRFEQVGADIEVCRFRAALSGAMAIAQSANKYLDRKEPWRAVKTDRKGAATTLWVALNVVNCLKTAFYPFIPFSSKRLHGMLGLDGDLSDEGWTWNPDGVAGGEPLQQPEQLFAKLDEEIIEREMARIGQ